MINTSIFYSQIIFHCTDIPHFISPFISRWDCNFESNVKLSNNLVSDILSMKGFPEVRTGWASDTINHNQLLKIMTQSTTGCSLPPIHLKKKKEKTTKQNSLEAETLESILVLVSFAVKYPKWLQSELKFPSGVSSFYLLLRKKMKPRKESDLKVTATISGKVESQI